MPLDHELYQVAFDALARMQEPDFSQYDEERVFQAFFRLYNGDEGLSTRGDPKYLDYICEEVIKASEGKVTMETTEFDTGIKGPNTQFLLTDGKTTKKVVFGPYSPPFDFWD